MYGCSEIVRLISSDEYLTAGVFSRLGIRLHLMMCKYCSRYVRQLRAIAAAFRKTQGTVPASQIESAKSQILQKLLEK